MSEQEEGVDVPPPIAANDSLPQSINPPDSAAVNPLPPSVINCFMTSHTLSSLERMNESR